ncbi:CGNR zinc finger domain-containing protein [Allokutzneria sp. A3M-2-11 16]|uniref:CGNR zinc finger domain-containing protein n=1 Tax=Allokutzneria sp. A3M-2-11 16 TaxID=2962043 RepID=UPI0020B8968D|nr:CGNR zinc finger domain-containing protein [Allokutzneria sp. A3M-2-11 16]MCP3799058.1 CGNR zinc finger domain-containing protein [Allokutzneria sp. A3M-2-11 16]
MTAWDTDHDVDLLLAFLNTRDEEKHTDVLDDVDEWQLWARTNGVQPPGAPADVRPLRDALRHAVAGRKHAPEIAVDLHTELRAGIPVLTPTTAAGAFMAAALRLTIVGDWDRFKICPAHTCQWAFYDRSRNRSRSWCSMQVCGNREKARTFRERTKT